MRLMYENNNTFNSHFTYRKTFNDIEDAYDSVYIILIL